MGRVVRVAKQGLVARKQGTQRQVSLPEKTSETQNRTLALVGEKWFYLDTRWEVVCPTTPFEKRGGISMEREEPKLEEESLRTLLLPSST